MESDGKLVDQAKEVLRGGYTDNAQSLLAQAIAINPDNEEAWLWLSGICDIEAERRYCLERVLAINPANDMAQRALRQLPAGVATQPALLNQHPPKPAAPRTSLSAAEVLKPAKLPKTTKTATSSPLTRLVQTMGIRQWVVLVFGIAAIGIVVFVANIAFFSDRDKHIAAIQTETALAIAAMPTPTFTHTPPPTPTSAATPTPTATHTTMPLTTTDSLTTTGTLTTTEPLTNTDGVTTTAAIDIDNDTNDTNDTTPTTAAIDNDTNNTNDTNDITPTTAANDNDTNDTTPTVMATLTPEPTLVQEREVDGYVANGGNMRSQPWITTDNVIGQVCPGDQVVILEEQPSWVHFRVVKLAAECHPDRVERDTGGWASSTLIAKTSFAVPNDYPELPVGLVPAIVSDVEYGDTLNVVIAGTPEQVRLIGLDTPDLGECFVNEGQVFTRDVIGELFVLLETDPKMNKDDTNDDGQLLRHVWLPNGQFLALELLQKGYAYNEATTHTYQQQFAQAEKDAKDEQAGLWSTETCNGKR